MSGFNDLPENTNDLTTYDDKIDLSGKIEETEEEEESFEDTLEKLKLRDQILRYNISFAKYLTAYQEKIVDMDNLDMDKLKKLHNEIKICVSSRTSGNLAKHNFNGVVCTIEKVAPIIGMNLKGLSSVLSESQEIQEIIEELNIKYDVLNYMPPEIRLCYLTLNTAIAINKENKKMDTIVNIMNEPVNQQHVQDYIDL